MSSGGRRRLALVAALALVVLAADAGVTSEYRRKLEATVEMPLDADVFRVPPGYNAPQQVGVAANLLCFLLGNLASPSLIILGVKKKDSILGSDIRFCRCTSRWATRRGRR